MKKIILSILALFVILVVLSIGIYNFVDINDYKDNITSLVKARTGNDIAIRGDIRLRVLPDIALDVSDVGIKSPNESDPSQIITASSAIFHLRFLPLLKKDFEISSIKLVNPLINITIFEDGSNNLSKSEDHAELLKNKNAPKSFSYNEQRDFINNQIIDIVKLNNFVIEDGKVNFSDKRKSLFVRIDNFNVETSLLTPENNPLKITGRFKLKEEIDSEFNIEGQYQLARDFYELSGLTIKLGNIVSHGEAGVDFRSSLPDYKIAFYFEDMDLNPYVPLIDILSPKQELSDEQASTPFSWDGKPIDFRILRSFNGHFSFKSNRILYKNIEIGSVTLNSYLRNGKFTLSVKEAEVLGGNINGESIIDVTANVPKVREKINLEEVDFTKSPVSLGILNNIGGRVSGGVMLTARGVSIKEFVKSLNGIISLRVDDGVLKKIDLASMSKNITSAFNVGQDASQQSIFKEMAGDFDVTAGVIKTDDFNYSSEMIDFNGEGVIDLPELAVNFKMVPKIRRSKDEIDTLTGMKMPLSISGSLLKPAFRLEMHNIVEDMIKNPKGTESLVKQIKSDFNGIKDTMKDGNKADESTSDIKDILNGGF